MFNKLLISALALSILLNVVFFLQQEKYRTMLTTAKRPADSSRFVPDEMDSLLAELALEQAIRGDLEYDLQAMQDTIEALERQLAQHHAKPAEDVSPPVAARREAGVATGGFDAAKLAELSLDPEQIDLIEAKHNQYALKRLELLNQVARAKGRERGEYFQEINQLQQQLRVELGDSQYDLLLYATGQPNRVEIMGVLPNSAAAQAGIQQGDLILSYGGEKIFSPTTVYQATQKGELSEPTEVIVQRGNERLTVYVPRGTLGTRFKASNIRPLAN